MKTSISNTVTAALTYWRDLRWQICPEVQLQLVPIELNFEVYNS